MKKPRATEQSLQWQWQNNRPAFLTWAVLRLLVLLVLIRSAINGL